MTDGQTVLLKKRRDMPRGPLAECHGGKGALDWVRVLDGRDVAGRAVNFIHDNVLAPGVSIGLHEHTDDEEYYYIVAGTGMMTLDDRRVEVAAGDVAAVFPGGKHALENTGSDDLRIIVISVSVG